MKKYSLKYSISIMLALLTVLSTFGRPSPASAMIDAEEMIRDIIAVVGLKPNFDVKAANIPNAAALTYNGKRYIAYNPTFIASLNAKAGNKWASVSILAHEIGHHLNGHTLLPTGSQPALELDADEFSGFVLQKMGATLAQAQVAMKLAADYKPSLTHPGQQDRLVAIAKGWNKASGARADMAKYNQPSPIQSPATIDARMSEQGGLIARQSPVRVPSAQPVLHSRYILAQVNFPSDRNTYYVTTQFNFVKVVGGQLQVLGKVMATNSAEYPFVLKNQRGTLYVDRNGRILTPAKELAGYLTKA